MLARRRTKARFSPKMTRLVAAKPCLEALEGRILLTAELLFNGHFEWGAAMYYSDYPLGSLLDTGNHTVVTDPSLAHRDAASYGDHTSGLGFMMAVNGALVPDQLVWGQTAMVNPHTEYDFSIWASTWYPLSPAQLDVLFNGVSIGTLTAPLQTGLWQQFARSWNSGPSRWVTISIINHNTGFSGNDFALDDISLRGKIGPLSDLAATALEWNDALGGVNFSYAVRDVNLPASTDLALYWAAGPTMDDILGSYVVSAAAQRAVGTYGPLHVSSSLLGQPAPGATHLLLVADPNGYIGESDEGNNVLALALPGGPGSAPGGTATPSFDPSAVSILLSALDGEAASWETVFAARRVRGAGPR